MFASYWVQYIYFGLATAFAMIRIFVPAKDSKGRRSHSLGGMHICLAFLFATVAVDSTNDKGLPPANCAPAAAFKAAGGKKRRRRGSSSPGTTARTVLKEKYFAILAALAMFCALYVVSHKQNKPVTQGIMAARAINPYEHEDPVNEAIVAILRNDPNDRATRDWFVNAVLAKQGVKAESKAESAEPEDPDMGNIALMRGSPPPGTEEAENL